MSSRWQVIDLVDYSGEVKSARGRLLINEKEVVLTEAVCILVGESTRWDGSLFALASKYEVPVLCCDWRGVPYSVTSFISSNSRVAARHIAQARLSIPRQKNAWKSIVRAKIRGQAHNLSSGSQEQAKLLSLVSQVRSGDVTNVEARAARTYWNSLWQEEGFVRDQNQGGRNALLNYGYAVIRGTVIRGILVSGLMPSLGVWHRNRSNSFALADDIIEPFRPAVDAVVMSLQVTDDLADPFVKQKLVGSLNAKMDEQGFSVSTRISELCQRLARYVEGESEHLEVPYWQGENG